MGKRYYCDYCDRNFIDDIESRKKHINSANHLRLKKMHYAKCRDLATLVEEENKKDECKKFRNQGYCAFEESCTFTHYSREELTSFAAEVKNMKKAKILESKLPSIEDWLKKRQSSTASNKRSESSDHSNIFQDYNPAMLPPSLQPVSITNIINVNFQSWG